MVRAQYGAQVLPVLWTQVVCTQPQLSQVLIELHSSHCVQYVEYSCICTWIRIYMYRYMYMYINWTLHWQIKDTTSTDSLVIV